MPSEETAEIIFEETAAFATSLIYRMLYSNVGSLEKWEKAARTIAKRKSVLIVGAGNIGSRVAAKLEGTVRVLRYDVLDESTGTLKEMLGEADVVSLHIPLTAENRSFIGASELAAMKDGAALVNTARGPIVDEDALFNELSSGRLRAAFDVFWEEPYRGRLSQLGPDRFFMTPHVASTSIDFLEGLLKDFREFVDSIC